MNTMSIFYSFFFYSYFVSMKAVIREERIDHLVLSAREVFSNKGFAKTSISDICKQARCSRTTLYSYFATKENLYLAVVQKAFNDFLNHFASLQNQSLSGYDQIRSYALGYYSFSVQMPKQYDFVIDFYNVLRNIDDETVRTEGHADILNSSNFESLKQLAQLPFQILTEEIKKGQQDGSINKSYSCEQHMINLWAYLKGITDVMPNIKIIGPAYQDFNESGNMIRAFLLRSFGS